MNMTGFQNTNYGARTNRSYQSTNLSRSSTQLSGKEPQASFSEKLKQAAGGKEEVDLYKEEMEQNLSFQNAGRLRGNTGEEHVLFQSEKEKTGVFSKKTLAELAGYKLDHEIDWGADGTAGLTEGQIQYLKEKYDVENLTETDYYNLLAELTEMNVLSGTDVERQFVRHAPCTAMVTAYRDLEMDEDKACAGNYLKKLQKELDETKVLLSMLKAGRCSISPEETLGSVYAFYEQEQEYNKKMAGIFQQLQRDASKAVSASEQTKS